MYFAFIRPCLSIVTQFGTTVPIKQDEAARIRPDFFYKLITGFFFRFRDGGGDEKKEKKL